MAARLRLKRLLASNIEGEEARATISIPCDGVVGCPALSVLSSKYSGLLTFLGVAGTDAIAPALLAGVLLPGVLLVVDDVLSGGGLKPGVKFSVSETDTTTEAASLTDSPSDSIASSGSTSAAAALLLRLAGECTGEMI